VKTREKSTSVKATVSSVTPIVIDGRHNAFTDMCEWRGHYYVAFRKAQTHGVSPPGDVVVMRCEVGDIIRKGIHDDLYWRVVQVFDTDGDDRDPKFLARDDRLILFWGTYYERWGDNKRSIKGAMYDLISHLSHSRDGLCWSTPIQIYRPNYWIWSMVEGESDVIAAAYHHGDEGDVMSIHLLRSDNLLWWRRDIPPVVESWDFPEVSEPVVFYWEERLACLIRGSDAGGSALLAVKNDAGSWEFNDLGIPIHAAARIAYKDGQIVVGRTEKGDPAPKKKTDEFEGKVYWAKKRKFETRAWWLADPYAQIEEIATLPSAGDNGYAGLSRGAESGRLLACYYSQHRRDLPMVGWPHSSDIFLADIRIE